MLPPDGAPVPKTKWQHYVGHKDASSLAEQRASLFFGLDFTTHARIDVPLSALDRGHCHIEGRIGAGKTAGSLISIIRQGIHGYRDQNGRWSRKSPVIVFDFKGDQALFHATRVAAENDGRQFRFFSTRTGDGCHFFNPFQIVGLRRLEPVQIAATFVRAMGLDYGLTYGGQYFSDNNVVLLNDALTLLQEAGGELTLGRLIEVLEPLGRNKASADARHILLSLRKLAEYPQINLGKLSRVPAAQIDMFRALEQGEVIYIFMEMDSDAPALRQIAGLLLDALAHSAKSLRRSGKEVPFTYVVADEFYHIANKSFGELLAMSRDWGLHFFLANQTRRQLESHDPALPEVVRTNMSVRQAYTVDGKEARDEWKQLSGEKIDFGRSQLINALGELSNAFAEFRTWELSERLLNAITDTQLASLLYVDTGKPSSQGQRVKCVQGLYPTFNWEHEMYRHAPLPTGPQLELKRNQPTEAASPTAAPGRNKPQQVTAASQRNKELQERMNRRWTAISSEESAA